MNIVLDLLKKEKVDKYKAEIDKLRVKTKTYKGRAVEYYDLKLEARLFEIVREWTLDLDRYFMPKKSDFAGL